MGKDFPVYLLNNAQFESLLSLADIPCPVADFWPTNYPVEVAVARKERSTGQAHNEFIVETDGVSLKSDLSRRDLTRNAIAMLPDGTIVDPCKGTADIKCGILRETNPAAFAEDPLRVLRVARFRANNPSLIITPSLLSAIQQTLPAMKSLASERIWAEIVKSDNILEFFNALHDMKALMPLFPLIADLETCVETSKYHLEKNVLVHTFMVLNELPYDCPMHIQIAALFHDVAKPKAYRKHGKGYGHENLEEFGISLPLWIPAKIRAKAALLIKNHQMIYIAHSMRPQKLANFIKQYTSHSADSLLQDQLTLARADKAGRITDEPMSMYMSEFLPLLQADIMRYSPVPWIEAQEVSPTPGQISDQRVRDETALARQYKIFIKAKENDKH